MMPRNVRRLIACRRGAFILSLAVGLSAWQGLSAAEAPGARLQPSDGLDLRRVVVVTPSEATRPERGAVRMLVEEVEKRTRLRWAVSHEWPGEAVPVIAVGPASALPALAGPFKEDASALLPPKSPESYRVAVAAGKRSGPSVFVVGNDTRGVLFGVGRLLRELRMRTDQVTLAPKLNIATAPETPLRGHQLGFRPKTNSYDAWTAAMWEQYYRDLIVFGANAIELIPPRSDDDDDSPHFPLPKIEMMARMSQIADDYDLDVWIWYPAMDKDYSDSATVEFALKEWGEVFAKLPRIDVIFVPGGDPGHTQPKHLMALLAKQTESLRRHHPEAQMWMSPQSFTREWMDEFYEYMRTVQPKWLGGIVFGPQNRDSLPALRAAVDKRYPIRRYPDITHSMRCQYAVPDWDVAYAMTEEREVINPRPMGYAHIYRLWKDQACGFLTYSEGCNDDVNKTVWSGLGWDSSADVADILREYSGYFISDEYRDDFAQGLLGLERNWQGPLLTNEGVETTLQWFQAMERSATPQDLLNWRFQQGLYRAYYDAYLRRRLIYETELEKQAMDELRRARRTGSLVALDRAEAILERAVTGPVAQDLRARVFELAEALYQSIRMQLSVLRYKAIHWGRGGNLDLIDRPLNDRVWLKAQFADIRRITGEDVRVRSIKGIVNWTDPGPGGFYDDLGNLTRQPHLVRGPAYNEDPEFRARSRVGFAYVPGRRLSWVRHAEARYDAPLRMQYDDLDPAAQYRVRLVYAGDRFGIRLQLLADEQHEVHPAMKKPRPLKPLEFDVPPAATSDGKLTLTWQPAPGSKGAGRGNQVAEVWLMKK